MVARWEEETGDQSGVERIRKQAAAPRASQPTGRAAVASHSFSPSERQAQGESLFLSFAARVASVWPLSAGPG